MRRLIFITEIAALEAHFLKICGSLSFTEADNFGLQKMFF
jgi:hypothetical protein